MSTTKTPQFFEVPAGTPVGECRGCRAIVYWIVTDANRRMPVHCDVEGGVRPHRAPTPISGETKVAGRGISHFVDCPVAAKFRKAR